MGLLGSQIDDPDERLGYRFEVQQQIVLEYVEFVDRHTLLRDIEVLTGAVGVLLLHHFVVVASICISE